MSVVLSWEPPCCQVRWSPVSARLVSWDPPPVWGAYVLLVSTVRMPCASEATIYSFAQMVGVAVHEMGSASVCVQAFAPPVGSVLVSA